MNRNWHRHAASGLPILSAALISAVGLLWDGAHSSAAAQNHSGTSGNVIVNYDALNALSGQPAPNGAQGATMGMQPQPQFASGYVPPYAPYGAVRPGSPYGAPFVPGLAPPPPGMPASALTVLGPDGRPIAPFTLRKPVSEMPDADEQGTGSRMAAASPPDEPADMPTEVPMPQPTPPAPAPGVNADLPVSAPPAAGAAAVDTAAASPAPELPAADTPAEPPAEEQLAVEQAAQETPAATPPAETPSVETAQAKTSPGETPPAETPTAETSAAETPAAEGEAADAAAEEQPSEEAAAEQAAEPDNSQPAPPIPEGGIRIVYPADLNDVPVEANSALDDLAAQMQTDETMRIQIKCYASGTEDTESKARRRSLARCINIRQYLFKKDVRTTRMDVRALGLKSEGQPADRVDIVPANS